MSKRPPLGKLALAGKRNRERFLIASGVSEIAGTYYPWLLFPVPAGKAHHPATEGMLLALKALRRLVSAPPPPRPSSLVSIQIFARMVLPTLSRKLYLMEIMEVSLNLLLSLMQLMRNPIPVRRMTRTPMIRRDHLDPLVAERE
jgi:hypothetical protein